MKTPPFDNLGDWLSWQERLHPSEIELGLDRVQAVAGRLGLLAPESFVVTVGGTNGKGSSAAMLATALGASGYSVGLYSSPHIHQYNERIRINGELESDQALCEAFAAIESARADTSLTYFEYGTLAALWLFRQRNVEIMVLEVGLGGRLDAVNILDADLALVTNIGLDHLDWLGDTREAIAHEKAGIFRKAQRAVYNDIDPVPQMQTEADAMGANLHQLARDYALEVKDESWSWKMAAFEIADIPRHGAPAHQLVNAAGVCACLQLMSDQYPVDLAGQAGLLPGYVPAGRSERRLVSIGAANCEVILDVAHNAEAVQALAELLQCETGKGRTFAVFATMHDKPVEEIAQIMAPIVDQWFMGGLNIPRASTVEALQRRMGSAIHGIHASESLEDAFNEALSQLMPEDRLVVFGSFYTVEAALDIINRSAGNE